MTYAILRIEKIKSRAEIAGRSNHNHRHIPVPNADDKINNTILTGTSDAESDWQSRIDELGITKLRKNGVLAYEVLLTFSHDKKEQMLNLTNKQGELALDRWCNDSIEFLNKKFNKKNVVNAVLHLDEATPHIHAIIVPEHNGKMNARHFTGGKSKMRKIQDEYFECLKPAFSRLLRRGEKGSKAKHISIQQFYANGPAVIDALQQENSELKEQVTNLLIENDKLKSALHSIPFTSNPVPAQLSL